MGGLWTWRADYRGTTGAFLSLSSPRHHANEDVQVDALLVVEHVRDYKDARYASFPACRTLVIPIRPYSGTRLSTILDAVPDIDSKLNFPQVVRAPDVGQ